MNGEKIFSDRLKQSHFSNYGYTTTALLRSDEIKELLAFYERMSENQMGISFYTTHFSTDYDHKKRVHETIKSIVENKIKKLLPGYRIAFINFMVKAGGGNNPMPLHADWTYVMEPDNNSMAIWIPLIDTYKENGTIGIIPFSQHLSGAIRGPGISQWNAPIGELLIQNAGKLIALQAGESLIYDHRLLHYSPPNNTDTVRPAINISLVPIEVPVIHYTMPAHRDTIHQYSVGDDDFFLRYQNFQVPETGELVSSFDPLTVPTIDINVPSFLKKYHTRWGRFKATVLNFIS